MSEPLPSGGVSRTEALVVLTLSAVAGGLWSLLVGQDTNWDQRNYHIYSVHAWLTGRTFTDLAPAQIQTWLNPLFYVPSYLLILYTPPLVAGVTTGALSGLNGMLVWILARRLCASYPQSMARWCALWVTVIGVSGSMFLSFVGTTFGECLPPVLAALICITTARGSWPQSDGARLFAAGCCLGFACGVKLTNLVYALGLTTTLLVIWPFVRFRLAHMGAYAAGGAAGFVAGGGYWSAMLWTNFRNPVFPFFNGIFKSPWYEPVNFQDTAYLPESFLRAAFLYPFEWLLGFFRPSNPLFFREPRFAFVAMLLPVALAVALVRLRGNLRREPEGGDSTSARDFWVMSLFFVFSYVFWLTRFGVQRYLLALEVLTGVVLLLSLGRLLRSAREVAVVLALITVASLLWTRATDWGHVPYEASWYGITHAEDPTARTLYIMTGGEPTSYVIPYLPDTARFVRVASNMPLEPVLPLGQRALRIVYQHEGPIRTLSVGAAEHDRERLLRFGLRIEPSTCRSFRSRLDTFWTCALTRMPYSGGAQ